MYLSQFLAICLAVDLLLLAAESMLPGVFEGILPLGGKHIIQIGVLLIIGLAISQLLGAIRNLRDGGKGGGGSIL